MKEAAVQVGVGQQNLAARSQQLLCPKSLTSVTLMHIQDEKEMCLCVQFLAVSLSLVWAWVRPCCGVSSKQVFNGILKKKSAVQHH